MTANLVSVKPGHWLIDLSTHVTVGRNSYSALCPSEGLILLNTPMPVISLKALSPNVVAQELRLHPTIWRGRAQSMGHESGRLSSMWAYKWRYGKHREYACSKQSLSDV